MIWALAILPLINAVIDYLIIEAGARINHILEAIVRFVVICLLCICTPETIVLGCAIFWILFELTLNLLRDKPLLYVGYTAWTDRTIRKVFPDRPELFLAGIKLITLIIGIWLTH